MAKYTYACPECKKERIVELAYDKVIPNTVTCVCKENMKRRYQPSPIHYKGIGWGSGKRNGEKKNDR